MLSEDVCQFDSRIKFYEWVLVCFLSLKIIFVAVGRNEFILFFYFRILSHGDRSTEGTSNISSLP